jgi:hypothetical protein
VQATVDGLKLSNRVAVPVFHHNDLPLHKNKFAFKRSITNICQSSKTRVLQGVEQSAYGFKLQMQIA